MTRVDFYILPDKSSEQRNLFACRIAEKAFKLGHSIYIHSDDQNQAEALDKLLWRWRASSLFRTKLKVQKPMPTAETLSLLAAIRGKALQPGSMGY